MANVTQSVEIALEELLDADVRATAQSLAEGMSDIDDPMTSCDVVRANCVEGALDGEYREFYRAVVRQLDILRGI